MIPKKIEINQVFLCNKREYCKKMTINKEYLDSI